MKTKTLLTIVAGLSLVLVGLTSSALPPCGPFNITIDRWTITVVDTSTAGYTYTCTGQVRAPGCNSTPHSYGAVYATTNSEPPYT